MFGDDFQRGVVQERLLDYEGRESEVLRWNRMALLHSTNEPMISLEVGSKMYPLLFQSREGGISYLAVRLLNEFLSPLNSIRVFLLIIFSINLFLSFKIIVRLGIDSLLALLCYGMSPITLFFYGPYYADATMSIFSLGLFLYLSDEPKGRPRRNAVIDFITLSGFLTRIVFLWHTVFLFFLFPARKKLFIRFSIYFFILIVASIALTGIGPSNAGREFGSDLFVFKNVQVIGEFLTKALEIFVSENSYLNYFMRWQIPYQWIGIFIITAILKLFLLLSLKWDRRYVFAFLAYFLCVFFMTYHFSSPADYFLPLYLPIYIILWKSLKTKRQWLTSLFVVGQLFLTTFFVINYSIQGPIPAIDARFHDDASSQMMETTYFTGNRFYWGLPDYFSSSKVKTIYVEENIDKKIPRVDLCGFSWAEVAFTVKRSEGSECQAKGEGKVIWHPTRDAYIMLKEKNMNKEVGN